MTVLLPLLVGCAGETLIVFQDEQNYAFTSEITATSDVIRSGEDTTVDWSGLTTDLLGNPMDPSTDLSRIQIAQFGAMTQEEVLAGINDDNLLQSDIAGAVEYVILAGETDAMLTDFGILGTYVNPSTDIVEGGGTYLVAGITGASQFRMFHFFRPVVNAALAPVTLTSDSAELTYTVDLDVGLPIEMASNGRTRVDWSALTLGPSGQPIDLPDIDTLTLARYDEAPSDLEADFLHVDALAEEMWSHDVEGWGDWYLDELEDADGAAFDGFAHHGTWLIALRCSTCLNPAPPFLGVITPK